MSHAYLYESTPQHIIDEEATPGPVANWLDSSSSEDSSSSDSDSSTDSDRSRETVTKRVKRVIRGNRRRKSSVVSVDTSEGTAPGRTRTPSVGTPEANPINDEPLFEQSSTRANQFLSLHSGPSDENEEAVEDEKAGRHHHKRHRKRSSRKHRKHKHKAQTDSQADEGQQVTEKAVNQESLTVPMSGGTRRLDFAVSSTAANSEGATEAMSSRRPLTIRGMSLRPITKSLAPSVFVQQPDSAMPTVPSGPVPRVRYGIRRTNSLPDRLNQHYRRPPGAMLPSQVPLEAVGTGTVVNKGEEHPDNLSRVSAVILLLVSTALVAVCAEFMVDSINGLVATSSVGEIFIGLIVLPIVGNAAEHVTAITVAMKNKMDLAIGVAVGSSIQIALFITPIVVIIGWAMGRPMTLYFTLFETVCLFVSTFIVNFLVLDGRSNYLEGALLLATYVIIGLVAFFYPNSEQTSSWGA